MVMRRMLLISMPGVEPEDGDFIDDDDDDDDELYDEALEEDMDGL